MATQNRYGDENDGVADAYYQNVRVCVCVFIFRKSINNRMMDIVN